ncbi:hypothetical protein LXL04_020415 [Taraxacum kok-saghyz]
MILVEKYMKLVITGYWMRVCPYSSCSSFDSEYLDRLYGISKEIGRNWEVELLKPTVSFGILPILNKDINHEENEENNVVVIVAANNPNFSDFRLSKKETNSNQDKQQMNIIYNSNHNTLEKKPRLRLGKLTSIAARHRQDLQFHLQYVPHENFTTRRSRVNKSTLTTNDGLIYGKKGDTSKYGRAIAPLKLVGTEMKLVLAPPELDRNLDRLTDISFDFKLKLISSMCRNLNGSGYKSISMLGDKVSATDIEEAMCVGGMIEASCVEPLAGLKLMSREYYIADLLACWDLLRTHIFPRTRELPQFPISSKPLFLSKNRLWDPPKPFLRQNKKLCTYTKFFFAHMQSFWKKKSFFRKIFFATGLIFERFLAPRSRFFEKVNGLGVLGFSRIYEFSKDVDYIYIYTSGVPARCAGDSFIRRMVSFRETERPAISFRNDEMVGWKESLHSINHLKKPTKETNLDCHMANNAFNNV